MTAVYDYYQLAHPEEGVTSGFRYKTVPHVTLGGLANKEPMVEEQSASAPDAGQPTITVSHGAAPGVGEVHQQESRARVALDQTGGA